MTESLLVNKKLLTRTLSVNKELLTGTINLDHYGIIYFQAADTKIVVFGSAGNLGDF